MTGRSILCVTLCCFLCISCAEICSVVQNVCGMLGQNIELNCSIKRENSAITWRKDVTDLTIDNRTQKEKNDKYKVIVKNEHYNIVIMNSSFNDAGNYSCFANNNNNHIADCKYVLIEDHNKPMIKECKTKQNTDTRPKDLTFRNVLIGICGFIGLVALTVPFCYWVLKKFPVTCKVENQVETVEMDETRHYTGIEVDDNEVRHHTEIEVYENEARHYTEIEVVKNEVRTYTEIEVDENEARNYTELVVDEARNYTELVVDENEARNYTELVVGENEARNYSEIVIDDGEVQH